MFLFLIIVNIIIGIIVRNILILNNCECNNSNNSKKYSIILDYCKFKIGNNSWKYSIILNNCEFNLIKVWM